MNAVAPGVIETEMSQAVRDLAGDEVQARILLKRYGQPQEVAYAYGSWRPAGRVCHRGSAPRRRRFQDGVKGMGTGISKEEIAAVFPKVAETMADALGCDVDEVKLDVSLIEDLTPSRSTSSTGVPAGARAFKVKIPRGKIVEDARGDLPEAEFEQKGIVTEAGSAAAQVFCPRCRPSASSRR